MTNEILKCPKCGIYTLKISCPECSEKTLTPKPAKFSPLDRHGIHRRKYKQKYKTL